MAKSDLDNPSSSRSLARPAGNPYKPSSITHRDYEPEPPLAPFALKPMALGLDHARQCHGRPPHSAEMSVIDGNSSDLDRARMIIGIWKSRNRPRLPGLISIR